MNAAGDWPLWARLQRHADDAPNRTAYIEQGTGRSITYRTLVDAVIAAPRSASAVEILNVGNRIAFVVRLLAVLRAGGCVLPIDVTVPPAEADRLTQIAGGAVPDRPAVLLPSSGTTGQPKLVCRPRDGLHGMAGGVADAIGLLPTDRVLAAVPLAHSYGLEHGLLIPLWAGCTVLLCDGLDLPPVAAAWRSGPTVFPAVPSMLELLLRSELPANDSLRRVYTAGAPLPASVADAFETRYGFAVGQVYGMTEIGSVTYRDPARDAADSVGRSAAGVQLRIDHSGELLVRSPSMLSTYLGDPSAADRLVDGFFLTGDLAALSAAGELTLLGRAKLLIDVGGAKVNPLEVEAILAEHPGVATCVVLPLALSETIRKVRAIVVPTDPAGPPSATELRDFVRQRLARHKVPRLIEFRDGLPRTPAGKIARQLLALLAAMYVMGCAAKPDPIRRYAEMSPSDSLAVVRTRLANVKTVRGEADMTLTDPKGQTVHLDGAYLLAVPSRARLRAWKLGQAVFDLTIREDGAWAYLPREEAAPNLRQSMGRWLGLLGGGDFFVGDAEVTSDTLVLTRPEGDGLTLRCTVDRPTLTPRQYELFDTTGKSRFTLTLSDYRNSGTDQVWPMRITAKSEGGTVDIRTRDVEVNAELPEAAFRPPSRAVKLP